MFLQKTVLLQPRSCCLFGDGRSDRKYIYDTCFIFTINSCRSLSQMDHSQRERTGWGVERKPHVARQKNTQISSLHFLKMG